MARKLNKNRLQQTRILTIITLLIGIFGDTAIKQHDMIRILFLMTGLSLAAFCAIGRVYATAFIGGIKNEKLMRQGPYSLCRNPLYFFSIAGAAGVGLMSCSLVGFILITGGFIIVYKSLIDREEEHLAEKFGAEFESFRNATPRLLPSFKNYIQPDEFSFQPRYLLNAAKDSIWWFAPLAVFECANALQLQVSIFSFPIF